MTFFHARERLPGPLDHEAPDPTGGAELFVAHFGATFWGLGTSTSSTTQRRIGAVESG